MGLIVFFLNTIAKKNFDQIFLGKLKIFEFINWKCIKRVYSLYYTATLNPRLWGFALSNTLNARLSRCPCGPNSNSHTPNVRPNASRWNIGRIGSPPIGAHVGHVDYKLFVSISFGLGSLR